VPEVAHFLVGVTYGDVTVQEASAACDQKIAANQKAERTRKFKNLLEKKFGVEKLQEKFYCKNSES
jgi:hypothetical protein